MKNWQWMFLNRVKDGDVTKVGVIPSLLAIVVLAAGGLAGQASQPPSTKATKGQPAKAQAANPKPPSPPVAVVDPLRAPSLNQQLLIRLNNGTQGSARNQADDLLQLGKVQETGGALADAIQSWQKAAELYREIGDVPANALVQSYLGSAYLRLEQDKQAEAAFRRQLAISRTTGDVLSQIFAANNLSRLLIPRSAMGVDALLAESLSLASQIGSPHALVVTYTSLGMLAFQEGNYDRAMQNYQTGLTISRRAGDRMTEPALLNGVGDVYLARENFPSARQAYTQALAMSRSLSDRPNQFRAIDGLVAASEQLGRVAVVLPLLDERLELAQSLGNFHQELLSLQKLAQFHQQIGNYSIVDLYIQQAIAVAQTAQDPTEELLLIQRLTSFRRDPSAR